MRQLFSTNARLWAFGGLVLATLVAVTLAFPATGAAGAALLVLVGAAGAAVGGNAHRLRVSPPAWLVDAALVLLLCIVSARVFGKSWNHSGYRIYDWGPHHANLRHLVDGLREGHVPRWVMGVSTGDSPYELYAFLPYYLAAKAALWTNSTDLTLVLVRSAIVVHTLAAASTSLLARRVLGGPWAVLIGFLTLYDVGSVWGGGVDGLMNLGVTHSALGNALWPFVLIALLAHLRRPHWLLSVAIWLTVALAVACHPLGLVSGLATIAGLVCVALLARDVPAARALAGAVHVGLGMALVAAVWMPFSSRLVLYGVHFSEAGRLPWKIFGQMLSQPNPESSYAPLVYAGYLGILVAGLSRRAAPTLLACFSGVLLAGLFDQLYVLLDLTPSLETARFQTVRLASAAKAGVYVCGAYLVDRALGAVGPLWRDERRWALGAGLALTAAFIGRAAVPHFERLQRDLRALAEHDVPDVAGLHELSSWAREQNAAMRPDQFGRLLHEDDRRSYLVYHVNAESELPTVWVGPVSALFLRERIENASPASLRRFNVRWVMRADKPPTLGDPATERRFGRYIVRELPGWDGQLARVERGEGRAVVTHLEDERVDVVLSGTTEPALVALGMGYYPRWQATHDERGTLPVYALPSIDGGQLRVVAAWLPPGRTVFRPTGSLPSDGNGRAVTALALAAGLLGAALWAGVPAARRRLLRGLARALRWLGRRRRALWLAAAGVGATTLALAGFAAESAPARALQVGSGWRGTAVVEARSGGEYRRCPYSAVRGAYRCPGPVFVQDTISDLLWDAPPSPPLAVPAIHVAASGRAADVRISLQAELEGDYWVVTNGRPVRWALDEADPVEATSRPALRRFEPGASHALRFEATVTPERPVQVSFVRRDSVEPVRDYPEAPALSPLER